MTYISCVVPSCPSIFLSMLQIRFNIITVVLIKCHLLHQFQPNEIIPTRLNGEIFVKPFVYFFNWLYHNNQSEKFLPLLQCSTSKATGAIDEFLSLFSLLLFKCDNISFSIEHVWHQPIKESNKPPNPQTVKPVLIEF